MTASASPSRGQVCELEHLNVRLQPFPGSDALTWIGHVGIVLTNEREWGGVTTRILSILLVCWKRSGGWGAGTCAEAHFYISFLSVINMTPQNERSKKKSQLKYETLLSPLLPKQAHAVLNTMMATPAWMVVGGLKTPLSEHVCFLGGVISLFGKSHEMPQH